MGVFVAPGATTFTRMLRGARSAAIERAMKTTPPFVAAYAATPAWPTWLCTDPLKMMLPLSFSKGARASISEHESAKLAKAISSRIPLGRWGEPEDLAKAVLFLASDDSSYINAIELMVDGGATGAPWGAPILRG